ncbi:hypothetical protein PMIN06_001562 [Paraphaeosphaeria minitans]
MRLVLRSRAIASWGFLIRLTALVRRVGSRLRFSASYNLMRLFTVYVILVVLDVLFWMELILVSFTRLSGLGDASFVFGKMQGTWLFENTAMATTTYMPDGR